MHQRFERPFCDDLSHSRVLGGEGMIIPIIIMDIIIPPPGIRKHNLD
jgi:hypothetical protein